jgi:hypothetical protein
MSLPLVRRLRRAKKKRGTGGGDDGAVLSEPQINRRSGHHHVRASHLVLQTRRGGCIRVQASRRHSMGGLRAIALGHSAGGLARGVGVSLEWFKTFPTFTKHVIHLVADLRRGGLGIVTYL